MKAAKLFILILIIFVTFRQTCRFFVPALKEDIPWSTAVYDSQNHLLRFTLSRDEKFRLFVPFREIPSEIKEIFLHKEDKYFYYHFGINPIATAKAVQALVLGNSRRGASTITMQMLRLKHDFSTRSFSGKLKQWAYAIYYEFFYSKDEIFEAYLNLLPFGRNIEGIASASQIFFAKDLHRLNQKEAFSLGVIPQSPKLRGSRSDLALSQARSHLLQQRGENFENEVSLPLTINSPEDLPFLAPHFVNNLLQNHRRRELRTTLKWTQQKLLEQKLKEFVERHRALGVKNAAALLVDWRSNEVVAKVGSANYFDDKISGQVDGTLAHRSPGSTLKPFVYALAFDQGLLHTESLLKDSPASFGGFDPENFDQDFKGPISVSKALQTSRNLPAVSVASKLKNPNFYEFLQATGISSMKPAEHYGLAHVLGGLEVSMEDLVRLYSALANEGRLRSLVKLKSDSAVEQGHLFSREASHMILEILKGTPRSQSLGRQWSQDQLQVYWKTGTSHGFRDAWTVGIFGPYVLSVWLGNFNGESNPKFVGRDLAAPLFFEIVDALKTFERMPLEIGLAADLNLKSVEVCSLSGSLPGPHCRHKKLALFIPGVSPISACEVHREIWVHRMTGLRLCDGGDPQGHAVIHEFWDSDILKIFREAGIPRKAPPAWDTSCNLSVSSAFGRAPVITSPREGIVYNIRAEAPSQKIAFSAVTDADSKENFWFVNQSFAGKTSAKEALLWTAKPGRFTVRVVDDQGRSASRVLQVDAVF